ncbi:LOW QUALITY PROTEIN: FKBP_C domain-containing protein, partial [Cephalotus follicularis]
VHFTGHVVNGACLHSSHDKGPPFRFKLGQNKVFKGWDQGVASMKKRERAIFTIPSNLAYGEAGFLPLIPPNATLIFDIEMLSWSTIRDITGDGGILKKITRGEGWATPRDTLGLCKRSKKTERPNQTGVFVKYKVKLENGSIVSKSDEGVEFHIGEDYLCPALSIAVKTMRRGEKAELIVKFSYGINPNGNGPIDSFVHDPPASKLTIQLELVSWKCVTDITGDNKVLKKITKASEGFDHPNKGSLVQVICVGKLEDGIVFDRKVSDKEPFEFISSEEQINEGLDRAFLTMKKGEQALVTVNADYLCHEVQGTTNANTALYYEVQLVDF